MPESSHQTDSSWSRALSLATDALAAEPAGLLTDFDGTLSPIVDDHRDARLVRGAKSALTRLANRLAVVAVITGRAPLDARNRIGVPGLLVIGNHGTEWLEPDAQVPASTPAGQAIRESIANALSRVDGIPNASVEAKGLSATVHYRRAPDPISTRAAILGAIGEAPPGVELREGRMSVELRSAGLGDKGRATTAVIERFGLRGLVVMGDDVTDIDMFRAAGGLRADEGRVAIIGVGAGDEAPAVAAVADVVIADPIAVAALLTALAASP